MGHTVTINDNSDVNGYIYLIFVIMYAIHNNQNYKLRTNSDGGYKLNQNKIIGLVVRYITQQENISKIEVVVIYQHGDIFVVIGDMCIIWIVVNATYIIYEYKLDINSNGGSKLNQNQIIYHTLIGTISNIFMIEYCAEFDANVNEIYHIYQTGYEINKFDSITTIINVSYIVLYNITELIDIYAITCGEYLYVVMDYIISQAPMYVFMLLFVVWIHMSVAYYYHHVIYLDYCD